MGVLGNIMSAIFGSKVASTPQAKTATEGSTPLSTPASSPAASVQAEARSQGGAAAGGGSVDVAAVLDQAVAAKKEKLEWRTSIVDLMKALDLDSSLSSRKELAKDLHYDGDTGDSAKMNMWLHKQVMKKLAENGGKVPNELRT
ncbi:MAG TPA: DUF3597 domain-containing protein [Xanthobacteraceae bacterium]|jgi:hypothetical protein